MFGCGQRRGDCLEHYVCCRVLWDFLNAQAPLLFQDNHSHHDPDNYDDNSTTTLFAPQAPPDPYHTVPSILLLHAIFATYETIRARNMDRGVNDYTNKAGMLVNTLHFAITKHPDLEECLFLWDGKDHQHQQLPSHGHERKTLRTAVYSRTRP